MYENSSKENDDNNLSGKQASVSEQVRERVMIIKKTKIFLNQNLCSYYRMLYGKVKELAKEGLIDSFWISNRTIEIKELCKSWPAVSITHLTDLED